MTIGDGSTICSYNLVRIPIKIGNFQRDYVYIIGGLSCDIVLDVPWVRHFNPVIDWQHFILKFSNGKIVQRVPTTRESRRPRLFSISTKIVVWDMGRDSMGG